MRIKKIKLKNYRQYKDITINFCKEEEKLDLHVIIGLMGTGKTNLLNAINWCLYGDEPHLSRDSDQLPILNAMLLEVDQSDKEVFVELILENEEGKEIIISREEKFNNIKNRIKYLEIKYQDDAGNIKILTDEEAESMIERLFPKKIREFFFFDGERLDRYFRESSGQKIRHSVSLLSQIEMINIVYDKIDKILKELRKEAGKNSPRIEEIEKKLVEFENKLEETVKNLDYFRREKQRAKEIIENLTSKLKELPDIEMLESKRNELQNEVREINDILEKLHNEKKELLFKYTLIINFFPSIKKVLKIIEEKREKKEIPPPLRKDLLDSIVEQRKCLVCGRDLDDEAIRKIKTLINEIELSSVISKILVDIEWELKKYIEDVRDFKKRLGALVTQINYHESRLSKLNEELREIERKETGFNIENIKFWSKDRKKFEEKYEELTKNIGCYEVIKRDLEEKIKGLKDSLDLELRKESKLKDIKKKIEFCSKAMLILDKSKKIIMDEIKKEVELRTNDLFFGLIWKKDSFDKILIDQEYNLSLMHSSGFECLGTISGGEREILTLAFTLALHHVSGFDPPIIIDRPLAMVSGISRKKIVEALSQISEKKQIVLLFTPNDYSDEISNILERISSSKYELKFKEGEKEIEVLS